MGFVVFGGWCGWGGGCVELDLGVDGEVADRGEGVEDWSDVVVHGGLDVPGGRGCAGGEETEREVVGVGVFHGAAETASDALCKVRGSGCAGDVVVGEYLGDDGLLLGEEELELVCDECG